MKPYIVLITIIFSLFAVNAQVSLDELLKTNNINPVAYISIEELRNIQLSDSILILDSREASEYNVSHIESAKFVGFNKFSKKYFDAQVSDKDTPIVVYCSVGIRSDRISKKLQKMGYTNVKNLYGGIFEWKNKGFPILDSTNRETENIHVYSKIWSKWSLKGVKVYE
ncbi:MAG: rhodanese-related sulfurtransferase [Flavobacteriaceae bacterium]|jgi:rhodanese-related sulfurtransferase|uniref:rhodanese-like domain-containing protein n=1 Tax=Candidatus Marifrigoribacter sp. Uisw_064 TaxID=3230970 RepID=UPI003AD806A5